MNYFQLYHKGIPIGEPLPENKYFTVRWQFSGYNTEWKKVKRG